RDVMFEDLALGVRKVPDAADVREAGYQPVVPPGQAAVQAVAVASPVGKPVVFPVSPLSAPAGDAVAHEALPAVPALGRGGVDALGASLVGHTSAPPAFTPLPVGNAYRLRPAARDVTGRVARPRNAERRSELWR